MPRSPLVVQGVALGAVLGSYVAVRSGRVEAIEARVARAGRRGGPSVDLVLAHLTDLGSVYGLAGTSAALALGGRRRMAGEMLAAGALAWVGAQGAKPLLDRPRPYETGTPRLVAIPAGTSWPSGHSAVGAAIGTVVATSVPGRRRWGVRAIGTALAGFVGASRLHVGVHHTTDVIAGWGVGVLAAGLASRLVDVLRRRLS